MIKRRHLSAGKSHQIKCEAFGAKPQATISWWLGGKQVSTILDILEIGFIHTQRSGYVNTSGILNFLANTMSI